jgi:hypothetical protein
MTRPAMDNVSDWLRSCGVLLLLVAASLAQETPETQGADESAAKTPVTAWHVKRAHTISGGVIDDAVILVSAGRITGVGKDGVLAIPSHATHEERRACTVAPGFVHPAGLFFGAGERYDLTGSAAKGDETVRGRLDPQEADLKKLARSGFTTLAIVPSGGGLSGMVAVAKAVKPSQGLPDPAALIRDDKAAVAMAFDPATASREFFLKSIEKARKYITDLEAFKKAGKPAESKPAEAPKEGEAKPEEKKAEGEKKPEEKKPEEKKPEPPKEPAKDPKIQPLSDVLESKLASVLFISGASAFLHAEALFAADAGFRPAVAFTGAAFRGGPDAWRVVEGLKKLGVTVLMPPQISNVPFLATLRSTATILLDAGVPVAFMPEARDLDALERYRFELMQLVRHGVHCEDALRAATLTPAEVLGLGHRIGSLEAGRDADFVLYDGDPLAPTTKLVAVVVDGAVIHDAAEEAK